MVSRSLPFPHRCAGEEWAEITARPITVGVDRTQIGTIEIEPQDGRRLDPGAADETTPGDCAAADLDAGIDRRVTLTSGERT